MQAELPTAAGKPFPPLLCYENADKMDVPVITVVGFSSQRLWYTRGRGACSAAKLCKILVTSFFFK